MRNRRDTSEHCQERCRNAGVGEAKYIIRQMRALSAKAAAGVLVLGFAAACSNPFGRQYEYEEQLYLNADGSATVIINASIPALVALRGLPLGPSGAAAVNREARGALLVKVGCAEPRVGRPWTRRGRHFAQIRLTV